MLQSAELALKKNGRARAIQFSALTALCHALDCQPADLLTVQPQTTAGNPPIRIFHYLAEAMVSSLGLRVGVLLGRGQSLGA